MDMRQLISVVTESGVSTEHITAISQLIADRTKDENSPSKLNTDAFVHLVNQLGVPVTKELLFDLANNGKLQSVVKDINDDFVLFKGQAEIEPSEMSVDKAKEVVKKMAKRSAKKKVNT